MSVLLPCANPATAAALEELGATTINVATDLSPAALGELRAACAAPLDVYVEVPDDQGGFVRFYDVPAIVRAAAPVYVKLGLRNAPNIYPSGLHLEDLAVKLGRERVRRAELSCDCWPSARRSSSKAGATTALQTSGYQSSDACLAWRWLQDSRPEMSRCSQDPSISTTSLRGRPSRSRHPA